MKGTKNLLRVIFITLLLWVCFCQALSSIALITTNDGVGFGYAVALLTATTFGLIAGSIICLIAYKLRWLSFALILVGAFAIVVIGSLIKGNPNVGHQNVTFSRNQIVLALPLLSWILIYMQKHDR